MTTVLDTILNLCADDPTLGVPCLVGPPQMWKTTHLIQWAASRGATAIVVNPAQNEAEDTAGYARADRATRNGRVRARFTLPAIFPDAFYDDLEAGGDGSKWVLIVDELDKPRQAQTAHLLTALSWERRIRGLRFPPKMAVVCAMNPPERPLMEALCARLLFVPYPASQADAVAPFRSRPVGPLADLVLHVEEVRLPTLPATRGAMGKLERWMLRPEFWGDGADALQATVVRGLMSKEHAQAVLATLPSLIGSAAPLSVWAKSVSPAGLRAGMLKILGKLDPPGREELLTLLYNRAAADPTGEFFRVWNELAADSAFLDSIPGWPLEAKTA